MNVLLYASTTCSNSTEAAATDLRRKYPEAEIPSADTVHNYMKGNKFQTNARDSKHHRAE